MMLVEDGRIRLDDRVDPYIPELGAKQALRQGAKHIDDTEPTRSPITLQHLREYSVASDVLGRVVELVSGESVGG